jgi:hypothetical protein
MRGSKAYVCAATDIAIIYAAKKITSSAKRLVLLPRIVNISTNIAVVAKKMAVAMTPAMLVVPVIISTVVAIITKPTALAAIVWVRELSPRPLAGTQMATISATAAKASKT